MKRLTLPIAEAMHLPRSFRSAPRVAPRRRWVVLGVASLALGLLAAPAAAQVPPTSTTTSSTIPGATTSSTLDVDPPKTPAELEDAQKALVETLALAPKDSPAQPDDPFQSTVEAKATAARLALLRIEATNRSDAANIKALEAADALRVAKLKEVAAVKVRTAAIAELSDERARLSDLTVRAYVTGDDAAVGQYRALIEGDTTDPEAGRQILFAQVLDRQKKITEKAHKVLDKARAAVKDVRAVVAVTEQKAIETLSLATELTRKRAEAESAHIKAVALAEDTEGALRTAALLPSTPVSIDAPLIGMPRLNAADLAGWFRSKNYRPKVTTSIDDYAKWFIQEGRAEGIRGDIAFAQAVLETGGFTNTDSVLGNNFSGIGHYDNLPLGWTFATPRMGVRAQIQLLKSYAVKKPHYANTLVDKRLHGPAGCCQTWGDLTKKWATSPIYGPSVMALYTSLVDYALGRRALGQGFDDPMVLPAT